MNTEVFKPSGKKITAAVLLAVFAHLFISVAQIRTAGSSLAAVKDFWLTNFINGLPYLETDVLALKFLTFFTGAYALVWVVSKIVDIGSNLQDIAVKKMGKT